MHRSPDRDRSAVSPRRPPARRGRAPCPARRRRSAAPAGAAPRAAAAGRRGCRRVGSWVIVMVTRVPPASVSASSIRVVQVSGVSTSRVVTSRRGSQSTISPCGAPAGGAAAVEPARGADERRPDAGAAARSRPRRRRRRRRSRARGRRGRARPRRAVCGHLADAAAGRRRSAISGRRPRPRTRPGSRRAAAGRSCARADGRRCRGRSCGRRAAGSPATTRSRSASSGAAVPTSTTIRACARSASYSRRRNSYSEPWLKSSLGRRGYSAAGRKLCATWFGSPSTLRSRSSSTTSAAPSRASSAATAAGRGDDALGEHLGAHLGARARSSPS